LILAAAALLIASLVVLPWHSFYGLHFSATDAPNSKWGVCALLATVAVLVDWAFLTFAGEPQGRARRRRSLALSGLVLVLLLVKLLDHTGNLAYGVLVDFGLAAVLASATTVKARSPRP
jgi:hypothetical protein